MIRFDDTCQVFGLRGNTQQKALQLVQAFVAVSKTLSSNALAHFIQDHNIMVGVCPIQSNIPHRHQLLSQGNPGSVGSLYNGCSKQRPSNHQLAQENCQGKRDLSLSVEPCGTRSLSPAGLLSRLIPAPALCREGLSKY
jgi:hypothetical protein